MPRVRNPNRDKARLIYLRSSGQKALVNIAKELGVSPSEVRKWKSLDKKTRDKLLPEQREWISKKEKKCGSVTMKGSESELAAMYACQKEMTEDRLYKELASY